MSNLDEQKLDQLLKQQAELQKEIDEVRRVERAGALAKARELVVKYELTARELGVTSARRGTGTRAAVAPKYRDPVTGKTWTGRGKSPLWLTEAERQGKTRDSFLIK